jgi:ribonuclease HI
MYYKIDKLIKLDGRFKQDDKFKELQMFFKRKIGRTYLNVVIEQKRLIELINRKDIIIKGNKKKIDSNECFFIFTDGSSRNNRYSDAGVCLSAYAYIITKGKQILVRNSDGPYMKEMSQFSELLAINKAINKIKKSEYYNGNQIMLIGDSLSAIEGITEFAYIWRENDWRKVSSSDYISNRLLYESILDNISNLDISFSWVRSHTGKRNNFFYQLNSQVDKMVGKEVRKY